MAVILIVGGGGFVGRHAATALSQFGHRVYATVRPNAPVPPHAGIDWIPCDLAREKCSENWPSSCDHVLFLAQSRGWRNFPTNAADVFNVNLGALMQTVQYAIPAKVGQLIYLSTGSVYSQAGRPSLESDPIDATVARNYYATSKLAGEMLLRAFESLMRVVILRLFMPFGAGQSSEMLIPSLIRNIYRRLPVKLHRPDGLTANPVAIEDVSETLCRCLALERSVTLNVAGPRSMTLRSIAAAIGKVFGKDPLFEEQDGSPSCIAGDCTLLRSALGWSPQIDFESGLHQWRKSETIPLCSVE